MGEEWAAREFTERERQMWLHRKGEWDWFLISPDGVKFGPMMQETAQPLASILIMQSILSGDAAARLHEAEAALRREHQALLVLKAWIKSSKEDTATINFEGIASVVNDGYEAADAYFAASQPSEEGQQR